MTDTTTALGTLEHIDPSVLVLEANVRPSAPVDKDFVATIKQFGVLMPVLARRDEHGNVLVRAGQRRTLGAREAGVASIPVYITNADDQTAARIIEQIVENDQRKAITDGDRAAAYQQLAFEGLSVATIAKRVGVKRATVEAGIAVAENATAATAIHQHELTLDQAAVLIEFEGDDATVANLIEVATENPGGFEHAAQRARDDRARTQAITAAQDEAAGRGFVVLERQPSTWEKDDHTSIQELATAAGERATVEDIADIEGRAVFVSTDWQGEVLTRYYLPTDGFKEAGFKKVAANGEVRQPMTEDEKAERKVLIANNKAWKSAETVRRAWLAGLVNRKTLPKDAARFVGRGLTEFAADAARGTQNGNVLAHEFFDVERSGYYSPDKLAAIIEATPTKAVHVSLAVVLGAIEGGTSVNTWRNPDRAAAAYFAQIAAWGYPLSEVEQIVIDKQAELQEARAAQRTAYEAQADEIEPAPTDEDEMTGEDDGIFDE